MDVGFHPSTLSKSIRVFVALREVRGTVPSRIHAQLVAGSGSNQHGPSRFETKMH